MCQYSLLNTLIAFLALAAMLVGGPAWWPWRHHCNMPSMASPTNARPGDFWTCPDCGTHWWADGQLGEGGWLHWHKHQ